MITVVENETKKQVKEEKVFDIACFVLLCDNKKFNNQPSFALDLLGKPTFEWVTRVCPTRPTTIECNNSDNPLNVIKPYLREREWTLVLYGDTPLLTRYNIENILDFVSEKGLNVCKLTRGFVFRTEYIKRVDEIFAPQTYYFNEDEFLVAKNLEEFSQIEKTLQNRIVKFHQANGVEFENPENVYIESDVSIGKGSKICNNVYLAGETEILNNVVISSNAKLVNSKVGAFTKIADCKIYESSIKDNCVVADGVVIENKSFVGSNSTVGSNSVINSSSLAQNVSVGCMSCLNYARIYKDAIIGNCCCVCGKENEISRVLHKANVGDCSIIGKGVAVKEDAVIPFGTKLENANEDL